MLNIKERRRKENEARFDAWIVVIVKAAELEAISTQDLVSV